MGEAAGEAERADERVAGGSGDVILGGGYVTTCLRGKSKGFKGREDEEEGPLTTAMGDPVATPTATETCRLLNLPAELRNQIWEYAVVEAESIKLRPVRKHKYNNEPIETGAQPGITRVCSQIRGECLPMFYEQNAFRLYSDNLNLTKRGTFKGNKHSTLRCLNGCVEKLEHLEFQVCGHEGNFFKLELDKASGTFSLLPRIVVGVGEGEGWCIVNNTQALERACNYLQYVMNRSVQGIWLKPEQLIKLCTDLAQ